MIATPLLLAIALSQVVKADDSFDPETFCEGSFKCHLYCGGMARVARTCGPDGSTYDGPFDHECLCASDSEFMEKLEDCLECGWSLWSDYGPFITAALAECSLPTEPTGPTCGDAIAEATDASSGDSAEATTTGSAQTSAQTSVSTTSQDSSQTSAASSSQTSTGSSSETSTQSSTESSASEATSSSASSTETSSSATSTSASTGAGAKVVLSSGLVAIACALLM